MLPMKDRLREVRDRIGEAARRSARSPADVSLLAVSKTFPFETIREAYDLGLRDFGENRVQEAVEKIPLLPSDIRWHLIGRLQTNKINKTLGKFVLVQSVDSLDLARGLSARVGPEGQEVLLEVNTSGEASKAGVGPGMAVPTAVSIASLPGLRLRGLMTIGPLTGDTYRQREAFKRLKGLFDSIRALREVADGFSILSMGMSSDFPVAIEEGSTLVRVGSALFGERV